MTERKASFYYQENFFLRSILQNGPSELLLIRSLTKLYTLTSLSKKIAHEAPTDLSSDAASDLNSVVEVPY